MSYKIEITENSVSIRTQEQLFDADGNFVQMSKPNKVAFGIGDVAADPLNPTEKEKAEFIKERNKLIKRVVGKDLRDI